MKKIKKVIAIGLIGGVMGGVVLGLLGALMGIDFLHTSGGLTAVVAVFLPALITGYFSTVISGN